MLTGYNWDIIEDEADAADEAAEGTEADITGDGPIHTEGSSVGIDQQLVVVVEATAN